MIATRYRLTLVTTTDGQLAHNIEVNIHRTERLGCGCTRLHTTRPGPADGPLAGPMHLHVNRCPFHQANTPDGAGEAEAVQ